MDRVPLSESFFRRSGTRRSKRSRSATCCGASRKRTPARSRSRKSGPTARSTAWTYAQLTADAERLGRALASRHAQGARIAVYANNSPEWVLLELGSALAGVTLVTVNPAYQKRELAYVLEQSRAEAIYYVDEFRGSDMKAIVEEASAGIPALRHRIALTDHAALFDGDDRGTLPVVAPDHVTQIQLHVGHDRLPQRRAFSTTTAWSRTPGTYGSLGLGAATPSCTSCRCSHHRLRDLVLGILDAGATMLLARCSIRRWPCG